MNSLKELLQSADQLNPSSTMSMEWSSAVRASVNRARIHRKVITAGSTIVLILLVLFGGTNIYAQSVSPDHPLYPLKHLSENMIIFVAPQGKKAFVYRHLIDRRVEEAKARPELIGIIIPNLNELIAGQEQVLTPQTEFNTLFSETVAQTTMFEQDIERLRQTRQAEEVALALSLHHQRLLEQLQGRDTEGIPSPQQFKLIPQNLLVNFFTISSGQIPTETRESLSKLESLKTELIHNPSPDPLQYLRFLTTRNNIHIQLLEEAR